MAISLFGIEFQLGRCSELVKGNPPSSASSSNHVKVLAWLRGAVRINTFHDLLQDVEGRKSADSSAIKTEEVEFLTCS